MHKTHHYQKRVSQRSIRSNLFEVLEKFGVKSGDKLVLNKKSAESAIKELDAIKRKLIRVSDSGGLVMVCMNDHLITAYQCNSFLR